MIDGKATAGHSILRDLNALADGLKASKHIQNIQKKY
jgi:hypothetical protein